jgi:hypothetical protein
LVKPSARQICGFTVQRGYAPENPAGTITPKDEIEMLVATGPKGMGQMEFF